MLCILILFSLYILYLLVFSLSFQLFCGDNQRFLISAWLHIWVFSIWFLLFLSYLEYPYFEVVRYSSIMFCKCFLQRSCFLWGVDLCIGYEVKGPISFISAGLTNCSRTISLKIHHFLTELQNHTIFQVSKYSLAYFSAPQFVSLCIGYPFMKNHTDLLKLFYNEVDSR